jgi:serine/threonine protein kinase
MRFLHNSSILHRDLKSANVLIDRDGRCKIADFGLSTFTDSTATQTAGILATPAWADPEVDDVVKHSEASDMYSYGVIVWEVFSGQVPWEGIPAMTILKLTVCKGQRLVIPDTLPMAVRGFLTTTFGETKQRLSFRSTYELFQEWLSTHQEEERRRAMSTSASTLSEEERMEAMMEVMMKKFSRVVGEHVEGATGEMVRAMDSIVGQHVAPLQETVTRLERHILGLGDIFEEMRKELLSLDNGEGLVRLEEFWSTKMEKLEVLVRSSSCDEARLIKEMKMIGNSLSTQVLELDLSVDSDAVVRELNKVRDELVKANTAQNEEMMNELLEELKRMIAN